MGSITIGGKKVKDFTVSGKKVDVLIVGGKKLTIKQDITLKFGNFKTAAAPIGRIEVDGVKLDFNALLLFEGSDGENYFYEKTDQASYSVKQEMLSTNIKKVKSDAGKELELVIPITVTVFIKEVDLKIHGVQLNFKDGGMIDHTITFVLGSTRTIDSLDIMQDPTKYYTTLPTTTLISDHMQEFQKIKTK